VASLVVIAKLRFPPKRSNSEGIERLFLDFVAFASGRSDALIVGTSPGVGRDQRLL